MIAANQVAKRHQPRQRTIQNPRALHHMPSHCDRRHAVGRGRLCLRESWKWRAAHIKSLVPNVCRVPTEIPSYNTPGLCVFVWVHFPHEMLRLAHLGLSTPAERPLWTHTRQPQHCKRAILRVLKCIFVREARKFVTCVAASNGSVSCVACPDSFRCSVTR